MLSIALLASLIAAVPDPAIVSQSPRRERRGLTVTGGIGNVYGMLGGQLRYDLPVRPWLTLAPFAAVGFFPGEGTTFWQGAGGLTAALGRRHRLAADVAVVPMYGEELNLHGTVLDSRVIYGPSIAGGYEFFSNGGFVWRLLIGYGWGLWGKGAGPFDSDLTLALGIGARVW